jgi:hypothetical protein
MGPVSLIGEAIDTRLQFFQFYLAVTMLTALTVVADLKNRQRLHHQAKGNEARFRVLAIIRPTCSSMSRSTGASAIFSPSITSAERGMMRPSSLARNSLLLVAPEHRAKVVAAHYAVVARRVTRNPYEYLGLSIDGTTRWFESQSRAILPTSRARSKACLQSRATFQRAR